MSDNATLAIDGLRHELDLATGDADSIDRKASLIPAILAGVVALGMGDSGAHYSDGALTYLRLGFVFAGFAVGFAALTISPGRRKIGPDANQLLAGLDLEPDDFERRVARSLRNSVVYQTDRNNETAKRLIATTSLAAISIVLLLAARFAP